MAREKHGTLELVRQEIRGLITVSTRVDSVTNSGKDFRLGLNAALKLIDELEEEQWCLADLDADQEAFGLL